MTLVGDILSRFRGYPVFTYRDVRMSFRGSVSDGSLFRALSYLKSTGKVFTISKGRYTTQRDTAVSGFAFAPFYYGLRYAMTVRDLWTQNARPEIVTLKTVRAARVRVFEGLGYAYLHHSKPRYFFGFTNVQYGGLTVPVSDPEKTLVDLFYYREKLAIQEYAGLLKAVKVSKVNEYLKVYDGHTKAVVGNFIKRYKKLADRSELENAY